MQPSNTTISAVMRHIRLKAPASSCARDTETARAIAKAGWTPARKKARVADMRRRAKLRKRTDGNGAK